MWPGKLLNTALQGFRIGKMRSTKVAVGLSGGVDSSVTAAILKKRGYGVTGIFIEAVNDPGCRTDEDKREALKAAMKLGIPFQVIDLKREYKEKVLDYFIGEYKAGRTPNPDVVCNSEIKFGLFLEYVKKQGFDKLATGHYARVDDKGKLSRPKDLGKDQTYFLWKVKSEQLKDVLFPLGDLTKREVRIVAHELDLPNADKPDSMGVCMMGELSLHDFLKDKIGEEKGQVIWKNKVVGTHHGEWFYTIGQRGGWRINPKLQTSAMPPLYVIRKNKKTNQVIVGTKEECYTNKFQITNSTLQINAKNLYVRIRNLGELTKVTQLQGNRVILKDPVFAPAPGQSAVFYDSDGVVLGGGIISD